VHGGGPERTPPPAPETRGAMITTAAELVGLVLQVLMLAGIAYLIFWTRRQE
jgi:hypothetical protein